MSKLATVLLAASAPGTLAFTLAGGALRAARPILPAAPQMALGQTEVAAVVGTIDPSLPATLLAKTEADILLDEASSSSTSIAARHSALSFCGSSPLSSQSS